MRTGVKTMEFPDSGTWHCLAQWMSGRRTQCCLTSSSGRFEGERLGMATRRFPGMVEDRRGPSSCWRLEAAGCYRRADVRDDQMPRWQKPRAHRQLWLKDGAKWKRTPCSDERKDREQHERHGKSEPFRGRWRARHRRIAPDVRASRSQGPARGWCGSFAAGLNYRDP